MPEKERDMAYFHAVLDHIASLTLRHAAQRGRPMNARVAELCGLRQFRLLDKAVGRSGTRRSASAYRCGGHLRVRLAFLRRRRRGRYGVPVSHGAGTRTGGSSGAHGRGCDGLECGRPRGFRAGHLLLSLRTLPHGPPQCVRRDPVHEHAGRSWILPRVRQYSSPQPGADSSRIERARCDHHRATGCGAAFDEVRSACNRWRQPRYSARDPSG